VSARALTCLALLLCLAITGCGGGGDQDTTQGTGAAAAAAKERSSGLASTGEAARGKQGEGQSAEPVHNSPAEPNPPIAKERTPGSKAVAPGVPTTKGGDNSVQAFGTEGEENQAEQATRNLSAYLGARASKDWNAACEETSNQLKEELTKLVEQAKAKGSTEKPKGCPETLALVNEKAPALALQGAARIDRVLSFRTRQDGYAYLIFESRGEVEFVAMANENGAWKVNVLEPQAFEGTQGENQ
jgi:hypothetical protein